MTMDLPRVLPGRGVGSVVVIAGGGVLARDAARYTVIGHRQVKHRGYERITLFTGFTQFDAAHRHFAYQHAVVAGTLLVCSEVGSIDAAKVGEAHLANFKVRCAAVLGGFHQAQLEFDLAVIARLFALQVPLAHIGTTFGAPT